MRKIALISVLFLAACETEDEQRERVLKALPAGCDLIDLGSYKSIDSLVAIKCGDGLTLNGIGLRWSGKVHIKHEFAAYTPA